MVVEVIVEDVDVELVDGFAVEVVDVVVVVVERPGHIQVIVQLQLLSGLVGSGRGVPGKTATSDSK